MPTKCYMCDKQYTPELEGGLVLTLEERILSRQILKFSIELCHRCGLGVNELISKQKEFRSGDKPNDGFRPDALPPYVARFIDEASTEDSEGVAEVP